MKSNCGHGGGQSSSGGNEGLTVVLEERGSLFSEGREEVPFLLKPGVCTTAVWACGLSEVGVLLGEIVEEGGVGSWRSVRKPQFLRQSNEI